MSIKTTINNGVETITFNRPQALNAFDDDMYKAVADALSAAAKNDAVSVVILSGEGRAFCAGTDLGEMADSARLEPGLVGQFPYFIRARSPPSPSPCWQR